MQIFMFSSIMISQSLYSTRIINQMKLNLSIFFSIIILVHSNWVRTLTPDQLTTQLEASKSIWFVQRGSSASAALQKVAAVLHGIFQIGFIKNDAADSYEFYGDDRSSPIAYTEDHQHELMIEFILNRNEVIIKERSKTARELKAKQEFQQKEKERIEEEWRLQQELRAKSDVTIIEGTNWEDMLNKIREPLLVNFHEANCSSCMELNKQWQKVGTEFRGRIRVAKVNLTEEGSQSLRETLKLQRYPSVCYYRQGQKKTGDFVIYQGLHKQFSIIEWATAKASEKAEKAEISPLTKENFDTLCKKTKSTCIILFSDGEDAALREKAEALALKHIKKPITFLISMKGEQPQFEKQTGVSTYPDTVMIYCKLKKIWRIGEANFQLIDDTINEISLGNRNGFSKYNYVENLI